MKTHNYNPSVFEVKLATAINACQDQIQQQLGNELRILDVENKPERDNPLLIFRLQDSDGDEHEVVLKIIQRPDKF